MARTVVIPSELENKLNELASLKQEVNGILLYRPQGEICQVEALYMTGVGTEGHVEAQPERVEVANEFFKRNPDYRFIKFHTHSRGTIEKYGTHYARNFSAEDITVLEEQLKDNPEYIGMLVTPETKILYCLDDPQIKVVTKSPRYTQRSNIVNQSLERVAKNLGYNLETLKATH